MYSTKVFLMTIAVAFSSCRASPRRAIEYGVRDATEACFQRSVEYSPLDGVAGEGRSVESNAKACQARCRNVAGCAYFSFWDDGGCHLQTSSATPRRSTAMASGPKQCENEATTPAPAPKTAAASDVHNQCDNLESWCTEFNKTDCCASTIQTSCPSLCHTCPARHCEWNDWVEGECSATCGVGTRENNRTKSVVEANGGTCSGQPTETVECKIKECPIPCEWSEWTVGECSKTCGGGKHTKTRTETVQADHGGEECDAEHSTIEESCNVQECPVDCEWSTWTIGQCSKTCGGGQRTDTRLKQVEAQFEGEECVGDASQQVSCNTDECAVCRTKDDKDSTTGMPPNPNVPCHFPFNWNGKTYNECTMDDHDQKWCGTQADVLENTTSLLEFGVTEGWGNCEETEICGHVVTTTAAPTKGLFKGSCAISGGSYSSGTISDGDNAFGYRSYKLLNTPTRWISAGLTRLTIGQNSGDITFTGSCDVFVVDQFGHFKCPSGTTCVDLTSDEISSDICSSQDNVEHGTGHNCFAHGTHGAWCGRDGNGKLKPATCDQPFKYVRKIEVRGSSFVYSYAPWTMIVTT